ncbi:MAG: MXAN_6640 family putative metalloprotease [bacterium]
MRFFSFLVLVVGLSSTAIADDYLPVDRQIEIIANYQRVTGQTKDIPAWALEAAGPEPEIIKCGTPAILEFLESYDRLDPSMLTAMKVQPQTRPDNLTDQYDTPSGRFRIHYTTIGADSVYRAHVDNNANGVPDYVDSIAAFADYVYGYIKDTLGYPPIPTDGYEPGGDERYDIYVKTLLPLYYGQTYPEQGTSGPDTTSPWIFTSYMVLRNEYNSLPGYRDKPYDAMRVTIAHEMFHAFQFGIDYSEFGGQAEPIGSRLTREYWMEMSAVWMEDQIYDSVNDYLAYLSSFFFNPGTSLEQFLNGLDLHPYACVVWPLYLSQKYGPEIVRDIWIRCGELGRGPQFKQAAQPAIDSISGGTENWATTFSEFALACYFVGPRYDFLPVEMHRTRHWLCSDGSFPNCLDSQLVTDTTKAYDKTTVDTVIFTGFEEAAQYPDWDWQRYIDSLQIYVQEDALHQFYDYPVFVRGDTNSHSPEINGLYMMTFENLGLLPVDTTFWKCNDWVDATCNDSTEVFDTIAHPYDFWHEDSSFNIYMGCGDGPGGIGVVPTLSQGWGANMIFQLEDKPDSVFVENRMLPDDKLFYHRVEDPWNYRSIRFAMSAAAPDSGLYERLVYRQQEISYYVGDSTLFDSSRVGLPPAVVHPFPNPAVVAQMEEPVVTFKFEVGTDQDANPKYSNPYLVVDIYTLAGERVVTIDGGGSLDRCGQFYLGTFCTEWDMKNESGADVASGVYIAFARLYSLPKRGELLAQAHEKVAVIR